MICICTCPAKRKRGVIKVQAKAKLKLSGKWSHIDSTAALQRHNTLMYCISIYVYTYVLYQEYTRDLLGNIDCTRVHKRQKVSQIQQAFSVHVCGVPTWGTSGPG